MTVPTSHVPDLAQARSWPLRRAWALLLLIAASPPAGAAVWVGQYDSTALRQKVSVRLTSPTDASGKAELRFESLSCAVALKPTAAGPAGSASYVIEKGTNEPGPYCGGWLGGQVQTSTNPGSKALTLTVTKGVDMKVDLYVIPAPPGP